MGKMVIYGVACGAILILLGTLIPAGIWQSVSFYTVGYLYAIIYNWEKLNEPEATA